MKDIEEARKLVIDECTDALNRIQDKESEVLLESILEAEQVFFVGVGRVLLSLKAFCKRLAHLGIKAHYVGEITEPAITSKDLLIVGSGSGESVFPLEIAKKAREIGAKVAWIGSNEDSSIAKLSDCTVRIPVQTKLGKEDEMKSGQPMTTLFEQTLLLYGDILSKAIIERKGLDMKELWRCHANLE